MIIRNKGLELSNEEKDNTIKSQNVRIADLESQLNERKPLTYRIDLVGDDTDDQKGDDAMYSPTRPDTDDQIEDDAMYSPTRPDTDDQIKDDAMYSPTRPEYKPPGLVATSSIDFQEQMAYLLTL
jgi:hypothetical protein